MSNEVRKEGRLSTSDIAGSTPSSATAGAVDDAVVDREVLSDEMPLFPEEEVNGFRTRWNAIQTGFVDEPRKAVEEADVLVAEVMKRLADVFARERGALEKQWDRGDQISTEDLRQALQHYRTFFARLLAI
jgi:hypothetical protein